MANDIKTTKLLSSLVRFTKLDRYPRSLILNPRSNDLFSSVVPPRVAPEIKTVEKNPLVELFFERVKEMRTADQIVELYRSEVIPNFQANDRLPFIKAIMKRAKIFILEEKDLDSALVIWNAVREDQGPVGSPTIVFRSIISVAKELADPTLPPEGRDIDTALKVWETACKFDGRFKYRLRVIQSMERTAKDLGFISKDIDAAIKICLDAYKLCSARGHYEHLVNSINEFAELTALEDFDSAARIWGALFDLIPNKKEAYLMVQQFANRLVASEILPAERKPALAVRIWEFLYPRYSDPEKLVLIKHMMSIARALSDLGSPRLSWDFNCAIKIWKAVYGFDHSPEQKKIVIGTMTFVSVRLEDTRRDKDKIDHHYARILREAINELELNPK
jgi:hypothetical protein